MSNPVQLRGGIWYGDLRHMDRPEFIAVYGAESDDGLILVDPGPSSCRGTLDDLLRAHGASIRDVRHVLLTHIHLDHAGVTGTLVREEPRITVYVHEHGARHMVDPSRLLQSARRIYGSAMEAKWGDVEPVPADRLHVLQGGERLTIGRRRLFAAYTPGHAVHHLAWLDEHEGVAWTGDVAGEGSRHGTPPLPVAPPPDIDPELWFKSIDLLQSWGVEQLLLTHFGPVATPSVHLDQLRRRLKEWSQHVKGLVQDTKSEDAILAEGFTEVETIRVMNRLTVEQQARVHVSGIRSSWDGLARYWRVRAARDAAMQRADEPNTPNVSDA